jgi:hypothetical protein
MPVAATNISISNAIKEKIEGDADLNTLVNGGVWTRPIKRDMRESTDPDPEPSIGSTPGAFEPTPPYRTLVSISIEEGTSEATTGGSHDAMWAFPTLWVRCRPVESEKQKLEEVFLRLRRLFHKKPLMLPSGSSCIVSVAGRMGPIDDKAVKGSVVMMVQFQLDGVWEVLP